MYASQNKDSESTCIYILNVNVIKQENNSFERKNSKMLYLFILYDFFNVLIYEKKRIKIILSIGFLLETLKSMSLIFFFTSKDVNITLNYIVSTLQFMIKI